MSTTNIRTGVIGYGLSGRVFHAPFIEVVEGYTLSKISTANAERSTAAKERYPNTEVVADAESIINDPNIDLVIVTSPNTDHFKWLCLPESMLWWRNHLLLMWQRQRN